MATKPLPSPETLRQLFLYEPETGTLFWRPRPRDMFPNQRAHASWNARFAGKRALTSKTQDGYWCGCIWRTAVLAHRVVWALHHGEWPIDVIDHINRDPSDNRICNLRLTDQSGNCKNRGKDARNTSGVTGVSFFKRKGTWRAYIHINRRRVHLGWHRTFEEAVAARRAAEQAHGYLGNHSTPSAASIARSKRQNPQHRQAT